MNQMLVLVRYGQYHVTNNSLMDIEEIDDYRQYSCFGDTNDPRQS
jgi:hypothetical protein